MAKQVDSTNIGTLLEALITKIKSFFWRKDETSELPIDNTPTSGSNNLVKSGGVYTALQGKYTKPSGGIPASDLASGVIPDVSQFITRSVNDLANYYLKSETYTKDEVASLIGAIQQFHYEIAASTSAVTDPSNNVLYLIGPTGSGADKYEEYVYSNGWVKIGDTSIDLSGYVTTQALNIALASYATTASLATVATSGSYNDLLNKPTIPPADYVAMIDITSSVDESGNVNVSAAIVSGTFAEIDAALLAQKTVLLIGRYPNSHVSYQYFRCGGHRPAAEIVFTSTGGGEWFRGFVTAATWYPAANGEPERVLVEDATGILGFSPTGDGNAVTSIEKNPLLPLAVVNKGKTFVDTAQQSLTDAQKSQARTNIGAGTYSKPANGIPASDLADGVIPTIPTEVFVVTYGTTTQDEIKAAVAAGQLPVCKYGDNLYVYAGESSADYSQFTSVLYDTAYRIYVKNSTWGSGSYGVYSKPSGGIPATDLADGVIPDVSQFITKSVNDLVNYYKKTETYTKDEVASLIGAIQQFHYEIAASTSAVTNPQSNVLYLIGPNGTGSDKYEEYVYTTEWVKIGDTSIDLSGYVTTQALNTALAGYVTSGALETALAGKQDKIDANHKLDYSLLSNTPAIPTQYAGSPTAGGFANKAVAIPFGSVDSDSTATDIKATVDNFPTTLTDGVCAYIRNDVIASASGFTLNINGTGAKPVYQTMADASRATTIFSAAVTYLFIYNSSRVEGGCWDIYYGYNSNDNTIGYILRTNYMSLPVTSACYRYRLLFTSADGTHFVPANASSSTNATATRTTTQTPIDPFGSIRYYNYTSAVSSGARPGVAYLCEQYQVTLGYSFNRTGAALTLTAWKPVYIKCAPQSDGSAIIDADTPYVQDLPTTADGKIYIFLGVATSATQVEVVFHHPVYYHDGTKICTWTGVTTNSGTETDEYLSKYLTFEVLSPGTIEWRTSAFTPSSAKKINYRINNGEWVESVTPSGVSSVTNTDAIIFVSQGDIVEISGVGTNPTGGLMVAFFAGTARFKAYGNIMSLIGGDDFVGLKTITVYRAFANLFSDCVGLVDASNLRLPATTLSSNCYEQMFLGCTSLTMPPMMLPATTLPISCYSSMFKNCTALTNVPVILATTLEMRCCDSMFYGCTSITASPSLRVISLANYCFENMFYGCTSLNYVIALFTDTPGSNYTNNWLYGVSATGTFVKNSSATWDVSGSSGIPSGWTVETTSR